MACYWIEGGRRLSGEIEIQGAKNSALPILAAALMAEGESVIFHCPKIADTAVAGQILTYLGCSVRRQDEGLVVDSSGAECRAIPERMMHRMRSSILFLGAMLSRFGRAELTYPGGCPLGKRPINLHLAALRQMGCQILEEGDTLFCEAPDGLKGETIRLPYPSVGATENILLAAVYAKGETILYNAAREPEICDLAAFLNRCGGSVRGAGTPVIRISGVKRLRGAAHTVIPDRIEAMTYLAAVGAAGGELMLKYTCTRDMEIPLNVFSECGLGLVSVDDMLYAVKKGRLTACRNIITAPYPAFPTDVQPIMAAMLLFARGESRITETVFSRRFDYLPQLERLGARVCATAQEAVIQGGVPLTGGEIEATDLRGGAALCVAALGAEGESKISGVEHIRRGYEDIVGKLTSAGAAIREEA